MSKRQNQEYELYKTFGIYSITNLINDKKYIGSTINPCQRKENHFSRLRKNKHCNKILQRSWNKYGENNFLFEMVEKVDDKNDLIKLEQKYIDLLKPVYNICKIAKSRLGVKASEETLAKMRKANLGKKLSEEHKRRLSEKMKSIIPKHNWNRGKPAWNSGLKMTEEYKKRQLDSYKKRKNYWKGKKLPQEMVLKIQDGRKWWKHHSVESKMKMGNPVFQYDLYNNLIGEFYSAQEAANRTNSRQTNIAQVCRGEKKTHNNYIWKYKIDKRKK